MSINKPKLHALVAEKAEPQFVCNLSWNDLDTLTDKQLEEMARTWCAGMGYTYVDFAEG